MTIEKLSEILQYIQENTGIIGFTIAENAWYFRNALVRANYTNLQKGIHETTEYLEAFLRNLLLKTCASHSRYFSDELDALSF